MIKISEELYLDADDYQYIIGQMRMRSPGKGLPPVETFVPERYCTGADSVIRYVSEQTHRKHVNLGHVEDCRDAIYRNADRALEAMGLLKPKK